MVNVPAFMLLGAVAAYVGSEGEDDVGHHLKVQRTRKPEKLENSNGIAKT